MNKKWLPHIIAVGAFVVLIVLGLACASTPSVPKEQKQKIKQLAESRSSSGLFTKPPLEGETVLDTFQDSLEKSVMPTISLEEAQAYNNNRVLPKYDRPTFALHEFAALLMIKAKAQFPDIDVEDLDVRSLEQVGDVHIRTNMNPNPIPDPGRLLGLPPGPPKFSFYAYETVNFKGVVVKRPGNKPSGGDTIDSNEKE